jgi:hypothetical protein
LPLQDVLSFWFCIVVKWYGFKSKDRKVQGYCPAKDGAGVARFVNYPLKDLIIKPVKWDKRKKEFVEVRNKLHKD